MRSFCGIHGLVDSFKSGHRTLRLKRNESANVGDLVTSDMIRWAPGPQKARAKRQRELDWSSNVRRTSRRRELAARRGFGRVFLSFVAESSFVTMPGTPSIVELPRERMRPL